MSKQKEPKYPLTEAEKALAGKYFLAHATRVDEEHGIGTFYHFVGKWTHDPKHRDIKLTRLLPEEKFPILKDCLTKAQAYHCVKDATDDFYEHDKSIIKNKTDAGKKRFFHAVRDWLKGHSERDINNAPLENLLQLSQKKFTGKVQTPEFNRNSWTTAATKHPSGFKPVGGFRKER